MPDANVVMAMTNTTRNGIRTSIQPVRGMTTAMVSMNAVVSHCAVAAVTLNSAISSGSATDMIVSLRITTNAAATSSEISRTVAAGSAAEAGELCGVAEASDVTIVLRKCELRE